jgi:hypothetical protein
MLSVSRPAGGPHLARYDDSADTAPANAVAVADDPSLDNLGGYVPDCSTAAELQRGSIVHRQQGRCARARQHPRPDHERDKPDDRHIPGHPGQPERNRPASVRPNGSTVGSLRRSFVVLEGTMSCAGAEAMIAEYFALPNEDRVTHSTAGCAESSARLQPSASETPSTAPARATMSSRCPETTTAPATICCETLIENHACLCNHR